MLEHRLLVLGVVVLGVLGDIAELAGNTDPFGDLAALLGLQMLDLLPELLVALSSEDDFLQSDLLNASNARRERAERAAIVARRPGPPQAHRYDRYVPAQDSPRLDLHAHWTLGGVEIPGRLVLAPMAGVSVQAFRRQGRRYGAGLVCSEMVSVAGIQHRNERTLGYLRVASDEHPLAIQIFGSDPAAMAEAARMVEAAGADIVDINFGCPVRKVTKTGAGASLLDDPDQAARIVEAVATATALPVSVKMRRGTVERLARLPRRRAAPGRGRRRLADASSALGEADVHGPRRSLADRRARRRSSTSP